MKRSYLIQIIKEEIQHVLKENPIGPGFEGDLPSNILDPLVKRLKDKGIDFQWPLKKDFITVGKYRVKYSDGKYIIFDFNDKELKTTSSIDEVINYLTWKPR